MGNKYYDSIMVLINYIKKQDRKYTIECKEAYNTAWILYDRYKNDMADDGVILSELDKLDELM